MSQRNVDPYGALGDVPSAERMEWYYRTRHGADVTTLVGMDSTEERIHRVFFTSQSEVFDEIFGNQDRVDLRNVRLETFRTLTKWIYLGVLEQAELQNIHHGPENLFDIATRFNLATLVRRLENMVQITLHNVLGYFDTAVTNNYKELKQRCLRIINQHAAVLFRSGEIIEISGDAFAEVLRSDDLRLDSELQVVETIKRLEVRKGREAVERFIPYVRFTCMSLEQFTVHVVLNSTFLDQADQIQVFVHFGMPQNSLPLPGFKFISRPRDYKRRIGGGQGSPHENNNLVEENDELDRPIIPFHVPAFLRRQ